MPTLLIWAMTPADGYQRYSETLITTYKTTRSHNPENHDQNKSLRSEYFFAFMQTIYAPSRVVSDMLMY